MNTIKKTIKISIILLVLVCAGQVAYTYFVTAVAQMVMPDKANGSRLYVNASGNQMMMFDACLAVAAP